MTDIAELKKLLAACPTLPWVRREGNNDHEIVSHAKLHRGQDTGYAIAMCSNTWLDECKMNPALVLAAVNSLPGLIQRIERLEAERDSMTRAREVLAAVREAATDHLKCPSSVTSHRLNEALDLRAYLTTP